jgi:2'-5' RNA ligase
MPPSVSLISEYTVCEYQLVIQPHEDLCDQIYTIKKSFAEKYELPANYSTRPWVTLIRFSRYEMAERAVIRGIRAVAATNVPFKVVLEDYGSFPTHTLYINIKTKEPIVHLIKQLKKLQKLVKQDKDHPPHFITEPYITVATRLLPWQYEKGWLEYSHTHFSGTFMANQLLLLKRETGEKKYQVLQSFKLTDQPVNLYQPILF